MRWFWRWVPGVSIGPFIFGEQITQYAEDYGLRKRKPDCSIADWETYEFPGFESWVIVEKGRIIEVHCEDAVEYEDRDLIGMLGSEVQEFLGKENSKEENVGFGSVLYYEDLGLTLFLEKDVVTAASCGLILEDPGG
jgi:hypothetical protein